MRLLSYRYVLAGLLLGCAGALSAERPPGEVSPPPPAATVEDDESATLVITVLEKREQHDPAPSVHAVVRIRGTSIQRETDEQGQVRLRDLEAGETTLQIMLPAAPTCTHVLNVRPGLQNLKLVVSVPTGGCMPTAPVAGNEARNREDSSPPA
jgi:hypothetical protein